MDRTRLLEACEIEFHTRERNMKPIRRWLAGHAFASESLLDPFRLMEAVVALRALHALGRTSQMRVYGQQLLRLAEASGFPYRIVEIRLILAQNDYVHDNLDFALEKMYAALQIGFAQDYQQVFVQEGSIAAALLQAHLKPGKRKGRGGSKRPDKPLADYARKLLKAFPESTAAAVPVTVNLLAHLSRQEQRVCQHMLEGKSNGIIAQSLGISLETVKKHCQHIYRKLGVHGRQALIDKLA